MACWSSTLARQPENEARTTGRGACQLATCGGLGPGVGDAPPALRSYWFSEQCARGRQGTGQQVQDYSPISISPHPGKLSQEGTSRPLAPQQAHHSLAALPDLGWDRAQCLSTGQSLLATTTHQSISRAPFHPTRGRARLQPQ